MSTPLGSSEMNFEAQSNLGQPERNKSTDWCVCAVRNSFSAVDGETWIIFPDWRQVMGDAEFPRDPNYQNRQKFVFLIPFKKFTVGFSLSKNFLVTSFFLKGNGREPWTFRSYSGTRRANIVTDAAGFPVAIASCSWLMSRMLTCWGIPTCYIARIIRQINGIK